MPDRRSHRGPHPEDSRLFAAALLPGLQEAAQHLGWLLSLGYPVDASLKLVGDRLALRERQRQALMRCACSEHAAARRAAHQVEEVHGQELWIDGFNLLITVEAALGGGVLLGARDGCLRDLASMHGSYRRVEETDQAIALVRESLQELSPGAIRWLLDSPVSNSGRLASRLREACAVWEVELVLDPDRVLAGVEGVVVSSDSAILDRAGRWLNLAPLVVGRVPGAWIVPIG